MNFDDQMDMYREAMDIHGELVNCRTCGTLIDELTVQHRVKGKCDCPSCDEIHLYPQCDRCFWDNWYKTHDPDTGECLVDEEGMFYSHYPECPNEGKEGHAWRNNWVQKERDERGKWTGGWYCDDCGEKWIGGVEV